MKVKLPGKVLAQLKTGVTLPDLRTEVPLSKLTMVCPAALFPQSEVLINAPTTEVPEQVIVNVLVEVLLADVHC